MRALKLISVALVMAAAGAAWAETVPSFPGTGDVAVINGQTEMAGHFYTRDREESTGYLAADGVSPLADGTYTRATPTSAFSPGLTQVQAADAHFMARSGVGGGTEDQWGIFAMRVIDAGAMFAPGTPTADISQKSPVDVSYEWADTNTMTGNTALVGIFYDGWTFSVTKAGATLTTQSKGTKFELWAVDKSSLLTTFNSQGPAYDGNAGIRSAQNRYAGWVTGAGTLLLTGNSVFEEFSGTQLSAAPLAFDGFSHLYFDVPVGGPGLWNPLLGTGDYFTAPNGAIADIKLTYDIDPGQNGWSVNSHDDGGFTFAVPEPLTMLGLVVGVGGVGRYMRRRMKAV